MIQKRRFAFRLLSAGSLLLLLLLAACKDPTPGSALVADSGPPSTGVTPTDGGAVDITQCSACQLAAQKAWSFEGIYRDSACTEPLAQLAPPACALIPVLGSTSLTYVDELGSRKAGETAAVTLVDQIAPEAVRFRKAGKDCLRANEAAVDITPMACGGSRVCRDQAGALACGGCRTFANGCPDFEETRMYATINDPAAKAKVAQGGGGNSLARLRQCCAALGAEAQRSPEMTAAATQCNLLVSAAGPGGTAPEVGMLRAALAGRNIPAVCAGF